MARQRQKTARGSPNTENTGNKARGNTLHFVEKSGRTQKIAALRRNEMPPANLRCPADSNTQKKEYAELLPKPAGIRLRGCLGKVIKITPHLRLAPESPIIQSEMCFHPFQTSDCAGFFCERVSHICDRMAICVKSILMHDKLVSQNGNHVSAKYPNSLPETIPQALPLGR